MATINETGHSINVKNLQAIITYCTAYGAKYNPSKSSIKIAALQQLLIDSNAAMQNVTDKLIQYNAAVNTRRSIFDPIKSLSTRLINALAVTDASDATIKDAKGFNRKIQGARASSLPTSLPPDTKTISTSQQSYTQIIEHFSKLIALLENEVSYTPNEPELQIATLKALIDTMRNASLSQTQAAAELNNARLLRNNVLYQDDTGLHAVALDVKKYVKSIYGATSPEYKQISGFSIKKLK